MAIQFRDASSFAKETLVVTGAAAAAGTAGFMLMAPATPLVAAAGAAALFGGSVAAAFTRTRPMNRALRGLLGVAGGALAAFGFSALSYRLGLGDLGVVLGGWLGGLALGGLLGAEEKMKPSSHVLGLVASSTVGGVGAFALTKIAAYAISEGTPAVFTAGFMAGALGLWIAAASGARRLETVKDPLLKRSDEVLEGLVEPLRTKVLDAMQTWREIEAGLDKGPIGSDTPMPAQNIGAETADEARLQARKLVESLLETAQTWKQIHGDLSSPRLKGIEDKLADLEKRAAETTDQVTAGHLQRASQALRAQKSAIDGLKVGCSRAEAAVDAQQALLERLRLAVAQHRVSDRERFAVEVSAVADQVSRLSDDLESLSAAIAEAEAFSDRKILADLERAGRRALTQLDDVAEEKQETVEVSLRN